MTIRLKPTEDTYQELVRIVDFLNEELFSGQLPPCLITLQRKTNCAGYYSRKRFHRTGGTDVVDELAFNPAYFPVVPLVEVLQTGSHELCHMWQYHYGTPSRSGYHNAEWSAKMVSIGLQPSDTGRPGGRHLGQTMSDYPIEGGLFIQAARKLINTGFGLSWLDRFPAPPPKTYSTLLAHGGTPSAAESTVLSGTAAVASLDQAGDIDPLFAMPAGYSKPSEPGELPVHNRSLREKYICKGCKTAVWGKPRLNVRCGDCDLPLVANRTA